jgi:hypothetical protein
MFNKLSAALVAVSVVAVAQHALALADNKAAGSSSKAPVVDSAMAAEAAKAAAKAKAKAEADAKAKLSSENKSEEPAEQPKPSSEN